MEGLTVEELLAKIQSSRARPKNVSYFAFTATPKHATMMLFGTRPDPSKPAGKDNLPFSLWYWRSKATPNRSSTATCSSISTDRPVSKKVARV